jgi:phenylacetate-coenzyme A ligase PaaK-like adenylate-forming protein
MFVHPNQLRFALGRIPGVAGYQALITRPENRDQFTLRVALVEEAADRETLVAALSTAIQSACRVKVDQFEFVSADDFDEGAQIILDERNW